MSSTFGALNAAQRGLTAANQGLSVTGHNIANTGTAGYTRQRVQTEAVAAPAQTGQLRLGATAAGQGVAVTGIERLGDTILDAKVRSSAATAGYTATRAEAYSNIESALAEPGPNGVSARLQSFWSSWQDVSNSPGEPAPVGALLQDAAAVASQISSGYSALDTQWTQQRGKLDTTVAGLNNTVSQVADLNGKIRSVLAAGGSPNEIIDQRNALVTEIAGLTGAAVRDAGDGTVDVLLGGNALVSGTDAHALRAAGATTMAGAAADLVRVEWADRANKTLSLTSGEIAGEVSVLAPADGAGTGGPIAQAADAFNSLALKLSTAVNAVHRTGTTADGRTGVDFFTQATGVPAALGLTVAATSANDIAAGAPGMGGHDGSIADAISQVGSGPSFPDASWSRSVTKIGVDSRAALQSGVMAENLHNAATDMQMSGASVSLDEESLNLLNYQRAYQANARVMTALDDMLDTLISKTGLVGR